MAQIEESVMAVYPVQNYLGSLVNYYRLEPDDQEQQRLPGAARRFSAGFQVAPVIALGVGGGNRGPNINAYGDGNALRQARQYQLEDRDTDRATSASCIGAILAIVGSAGLACVMSNCNEISERLDEAREFKGTQIPLIVNDQERAQLTQINNKDIKILEKKYSRARNIVILTAVALASAATAFAGGMLSIQWLITAGIVVGVITLAIGTFAAVYYCMQKSEKPEGILDYIQTHPNLFNQN
jgi:hypothetical protein